MITTIYCVYLALVLLGFQRLGGCRAALLALIFGWAFLPVMDYPVAFARAGPDGLGFREIVLLQPVFLNRGTVIGAAVLLGLLLFDRPTLSRLRWSWLDLPICIWCLLPLVAGTRNGLPVPETLANVAYLAMVWGVPYLVGRLYLTGIEGVRIAGASFIAAGVAYVPLCLFEVAFRPQLYTLLYGPHPHQLEGAGRWLGWRPVVFMEHGNQLGLWMAAVALVAWWAVRIGERRPVTRIAALVLPLTVLATQALAPVILMLISMLSLVFLRKLRAWVFVLFVLTPVLLYAAVRLTGAFRAEDTLNRLLGKRTVQSLKHSARLKSLAWRVSREEEHLPKLRERILLGHGRRDWWDGQYASPWGFWTHAVGSFGILGLTTFFAILVLPVLRLIGPRGYGDPPGPLGQHYVILAVVLGLTLLDSMLNSTLNTPFLAVAGGLAAGPPSAAPPSTP